MDSYTLKNFKEWKKEGYEKIWATRLCQNWICHCQMSCIFMYLKKKINKTQRNFSSWNLVNKLTYFILRKKIYSFIYSFVQEKMEINTITKLILGKYFGAFI